MPDNAKLQQLFDDLQRLQAAERDDPSLIPAPCSTGFDYEAADHAEAFQDWLDRLPDHTRRKADTLLTLFHTLEAPDPEMRVVSEINEHFAELTYFVFFRAIWEHAINQWIVDPGCWVEAEIQAGEHDPAGFFADARAALKRLFDMGADPADLGKLARFIAYSSTLRLLQILDINGPPDLPENTPGWALLETDGSYSITGRQLDDLHEMLLVADPSGRECCPE